MYGPRGKKATDPLEVSAADQRECEKRAHSRHLCVNRRESFSASTGAVQMCKGEEREQKRTLASSSSLLLMTWRFLPSQWPLRIKNDASSEVP